MRLLLLGAAVLGLIAANAAAADGDAKRGVEVFAKCRPCHAVETGGGKKLGPNLHGLFGRLSGSLEGYRYSEAMKAAGITWNEATLDAYLKSPKNFVPGNREPFAGLKEAQDRADIIAYLKEATR